MNPKCPKCGEPINAAAMLASMTSDKKKKSSAENGRLGGRPKNNTKARAKRWAGRKGK